jgi:hypothetical protein
MCYNFLISFYNHSFLSHTVFHILYLSIKLWIDWCKIKYVPTFLYSSHFYLKWYANLLLNTARDPCSDNSDDYSKGEMLYLIKETAFLMRLYE